MVSQQHFGVKKTSAVLALAIVLVYVPSLFCGFTWLDHTQVEAKQLICSSWQECVKSFVEPLQSGSDFYYRPAVKLSLTLDSLLFGMRPWGYHLINIIAHCATALIFLMALRMLFPFAMAVCIVFFWALHPLNVCVVSWISARADLLLGLFLGISFYGYVRFRQKGGKRFLFLAVLSFVVALLSKETAVVFPVILLAYEFCRGKRKQARWLPFFFGLSLLFVIAKIKVTSGLGTRVGFLRGEPMTVLFTMSVAILDYLSKSVLPLRISMSDAFPKVTTIHPMVVGSWAVVLGFFGLALKHYKSNKWFLFFAVWFFIFLAPASNIIPALHFRAARFLYLPLLGISGFLSLLVYKKSRIKVLCVILVPFVAVTFIRQFDFRNDLTLSQRALSVVPQTREAHQMLGMYYLKQKEYAQSRRYYQQAAIENTEYFAFADVPGIYNNLGVLALRASQVEEAIGYFKKALAVRESAASHLNLYFCFKKRGDQTKAQKSLSAARALDPELVLQYIP